MVQFRYSYFNKTDKDFIFECKDGETLKSLISRLVTVNYDLKLLKSFKVVINGLIIESENDYDNTVVYIRDNILIFPELLQGDNTSNLLQLGVIIGSVYTGGFVAGYLGLGQTAGAIASAAALSIGSKQLQYLLPTPSLNNNTDPQRSSQTYTLDSQSNAIKKFAKVHKVYGTHKVYPNLAATPYTDLELDPETGKLAQFFYAIYHVSQGQVKVSDIKIGSTSIDLFSGCTTRLVDPNKPVSDADEFDAAYSRQFELYKGSVRSESVGSELNSNENEGGAVSGYQIIRSAPENSSLKKQQIVVNLICPSGLASFNSNGDKGAAYIDVDVEFSKTSESVWRSFNDPQYVENYQAVGSSSFFRTETASTELDTPGFNTWNPESDSTVYSTLSYSGKNVFKTRYGYPVQRIEEFTIGLDLKNDYIAFKDTSGVAIGDKLLFNGQYLGTPVSSTPWISGYTRFRINYAQRYVPLFKCKRVTDLVTVDEFISGVAVTTVENNSLVNRIVKDTSLGRLAIANDDNQTHLASVRFTPRENAEYKVRITRKASRQRYSTQIINNLTVSNITSRYDENPINVTKRNSYLEVRLKATGQLSGTVDNLSCMASSVLQVYNGSSWVKQVTSNPAWLVADLLTGEVNKKPIATSKLDTTSLLDWANYCDAVPTSGGGYTYVDTRYKCNFILDFDITLQNLIAKITNACQASLRYTDGLYGVLQDRLQTVPVQVFTERNSSGFSATKSYSEPLHAIKATFVDPNKDWQPSTTICYASGYSSANATNIEEIDTFACTSMEQAFRFARYFLFQDTYRRENISKTVDFESLVCQRGDYTLITQEVMQVGGKACRVKSVDSGTGEVVVDDEFTLDSGDTHKYTYRNSTTGEIVEDQDVLSIEGPDTFILDGTLPSVGDLFIIGIVGQVTYGVIVKTIEALDGESARISFVQNSPDIYNFEDITAIPDYDPELSDIATASSKPPGLVSNLEVEANSYIVVGGAYQFYVDLDWDSPEGPTFKNFEVYVDYGSGYSLVDTVEISNYRYIVDSSNLDKVHNFKVLAVSPNGKKLNLVAATAVSTTPVDKTTRPSDISSFNADTTNELIQLFWQPVADSDIKNYSIRYSPELYARWERSEQLQVVSANTTLISTQTRTGTYLIKAIDLNGNESSNAKSIVTTVSSLNNLQVVQTIDDDNFSGIKDKVTVVNNRLVLAKDVDSTVLGEEVYYSEGYYYINGLFTADDVYQLRLQSVLDCTGVTASDLISNWDSLADVDSLYSVASTDWDAEIQYRATSSVNGISAWDSLADIDSIAEGTEAVWTEWRKLLVTDIQARYVQLRIKLSSFKSNVSPAVYSASVKVILTGRNEHKRNLTCTTSGLNVTFDDGFYSEPNIQITAENLGTSDHFEISNITKTGFRIEFFQGGSPVEKQFDYLALGYGKKSSVVL